MKTGAERGESFSLNYVLKGRIETNENRRERGKSFFFELCVDGAN
jgi:hypothetical protein